MFQRLKNVLSNNQPSTPTLSQVPYYVVEHDQRKQVKQGTIDWYTGAIKTLLASVGDDILITELRVSDLRKWQKEQEDAHMVSTVNARKRSIQSQLNKLAVLGLLPSYRDNGRTVANITDCIHFKPEGRKTCRAMTEETYKALFARADLKWRTILCVMWHSGIRRAELCSMRTDKLKFWENEAGELCTEFHVKGKMDMPRWVACKGQPAEMLQDWVENQRPRKTPNKYVFMGDGLKPMGLSTVNSAFRRYAKSAGIPDTEISNPHSMRHHYALWLLDRGLAVNVAAAAMGIDPSTFLENYVTPHDNQVREALLS